MLLKLIINMVSAISAPIKCVYRVLEEAILVLTRGFKIRFSTTLKIQHICYNLKSIEQYHFWWLSSYYKGEHNQAWYEILTSLSRFYIRAKCSFKKVYHTCIPKGYGLFCVGINECKTPNH